MNNYSQLTDIIQNHVQLLFTTANKPQLLYHNLVHTGQVVSATAEIANHYRLNEEDLFIVTAAAWFHDVGYLTEPEGHEARSGNEAIQFLTSLHAASSIAKAVNTCILATKMPQQPHNLCEQIVCDADLFHLGTDKFWEHTRELLEEFGAIHHTAMSKEEWRAKTIIMMQAHHYHTDYCHHLLDAKKQENIAGLLAKQKDSYP